MLGLIAALTSLGVGSAKKGFNNLRYGNTSPQRQKIAPADEKSTYYVEPANDGKLQLLLKIDDETGKVLSKTKGFVERDEYGDRWFVMAAANKINLDANARKQMQNFKCSRARQKAIEKGKDYYMVEEAKKDGTPARFVDMEGRFFTQWIVSVRRYSEKERMGKGDLNDLRYNIYVVRIYEPSLHYTGKLMKTVKEVYHTFDDYEFNFDDYEAMYTIYARQGCKGNDFPYQIPKEELVKEGSLKYEREMVGMQPDGTFLTNQQRSKTFKNQFVNINKMYEGFHAGVTYIPEIDTIIYNPWAVNKPEFYSSSIRRSYDALGSFSARDCALYYWLMYKGKYEDYVKYIKPEFGEDEWNSGFDHPALKYDYQKECQPFRFGYEATLKYNVYSAYTREKPYSRKWEESQKFYIETPEIETWRLKEIVKTYDDMKDTEEYETIKSLKEGDADKLNIDDRW